MENRSATRGMMIASLSLTLSAGFSADAQTNSRISNLSQKESLVTKHAKGTFDVKMNPQTDDKSAEPSIGRMTIDKQYHGDLEGTGKGQMLTAGTDVQGSGVYVAIEKVTCKLDGKNGSFAMQHSGTMTRGTPHLVITVVPDSGTGALVGITGKMMINIVDGKHFYEFDYTIEKSQ